MILRLQRRRVTTPDDILLPNVTMSRDSRRREMWHGSGLELDDITKRQLACRVSSVWSRGVTEDVKRRQGLWF